MAGVNGDLGSLTARRNDIIQKQQSNDNAINTNSSNVNTNSQNIATNTTNLTNAQKDVTTLSGKIDAKTDEKSGVAQEISALQSQMSGISDDEATQREIQEQIDTKELDMQALDKEISELNTDKTQKEAEVGDFTKEKGTLETEKTNLNTESAYLEKNKAELESALSVIEESILLKGAEMTNQTVTEENGTTKIVREYSNGATLTLNDYFIDGSYDGKTDQAVIKNKNGDVESSKFAYGVREYPDGTKAQTMEVKTAIYNTHELSLDRDAYFVNGKEESRMETTFKDGVKSESYYEEGKFDSRREITSYNESQGSLISGREKEEKYYDSNNQLKTIVEYTYETGKVKTGGEIDEDALREAKRQGMSSAEIEELKAMMSEESEDELITKIITKTTDVKTGKVETKVKEF